jgi:ribose transport system ATP-binding protein
MQREETMLKNNLLFKAENIDMLFPGTNALQDVDLEIYAGEVVGLVGENGAGKSTLLKIIMGVNQPTSGRMEVNGKEYAPRNLLQANAMGVGMVFQEQSLIQNLTVGQNIFLGQEKKCSKLGFINWKRLNKDAEQVLETIGVKNIQVGRKISYLDYATRQMVEIAKVFNIVRSASCEGLIILLDEPTSVLSENEVNQLFENIEKMRRAGNSIVFVSHRLDEVMKISDRIYILKDGRNVGLVNKEEASESVLYSKMVGRASTGEYFKVNRQTLPQKDVVLEVKNIGQRGFFKDVSFKLHKGEILGISGVVGSGIESLCATICGDEYLSVGEIIVNGERKTFSTPYDALKSGILSIPKERREEGIIGILSITENISLSSYKTMMKNGLISIKKQREKVKEWVSKLDIKCSRITERLNNLSGGNAQKVVFARVLCSGAWILILNHPTRGVDIGAKEEIYSLIRDITAGGTAVILISDTLDECIGLSNRIIVMKDGVITMEYDASPSCKPEQVDVVKYMM